jgi:hypothetical protein
MNNNIFLFIVVLILFLFYCKKKIKKRNIKTQKYGLTKLKNKDNIIEYYTSPPDQNCSQISKEFVNEMIEKQSDIRISLQKLSKASSEGDDELASRAQSEVATLNMEIKNLHDEMKAECKLRPNVCKIKYYGPDDDGSLENTICKSGEQNINNCGPASGRAGEIPNSVSDWEVPRQNGSRFIKFDKVVTMTWQEILNTNDFMINNDYIGPDDFEYELMMPFKYVIKYDKDNFKNLLSNFTGSQEVFKHNLYSNNPTYKFISPTSRDITNSRSDFENNTLTDDNDISRIKDILKILFMLDELGEIYTQDEITEINNKYVEEEEDSTIPEYTKQKYDEIISRVDGFSGEEALFYLKNKTANILVTSYKNIFDICDYIYEPEVDGLPKSSKEVQKSIDNKNFRRYYDENGKITSQGKINARNDCQVNNGEFIELLNNENDLLSKDYFCISNEPFKNPKNNYYHAHFDNDGNLINKKDFEKKEDYLNRIKQSDVIKKKIGIKSNNRIFSLGFDHLCKECDEKFNNNGVLGSTFEPKSQEYRIPSCVNSEVVKDENNRIVEPEKATKEFFVINNGGKFIKYVKTELEIQDQENTLSEADYFDSLSSS